MIDAYSKTPRPLREVDIEYSIDQSKCEQCEDAGLSWIRG